MKPVKYKKLYDSKTHNAHQIKFDNEKKYIVKLHKKGAERTLINEWIGYHLARYIQLPIPEITLMELPEDFIKQTPELNQDVLFTEKQLATSFIENCGNAHKNDVKEIVNKQSLAGIIVLDYWLANVDRTRKNVLFTETEEAKHELWVIDYGDSFGSFSWKLEDLDHLPGTIMESATHRMIASFIGNEEEFREQVSIIKAIPTLLLEEILSFIPDDWGLTEQEREKIIQSLLYRREKVLPQVVEQFIEQHYRQLL